MNFQICCTGSCICVSINNIINVINCIYLGLNPSWLIYFVVISIKEYNIEVIIICNGQVFVSERDISITTSSIHIYLSISSCNSYAGRRCCVFRQLDVTQANITITLICVNPLDVTDVLIKIVEFFVLSSSDSSICFQISIGHTVF